MAKEYTWVFKTGVKPRVQTTAMATKPVANKITFIIPPGRSRERDDPAGGVGSPAFSGGTDGRGCCQTRQMPMKAMVKFAAAASQSVCWNPKTSTQTTALMKVPVIAPTTFAR